MKAYIVDSHRFRGADFTYEKEFFDKNEIEFEIKTCKNEEEIVAQCSDADVLMVVYTKIGLKTMNALTNCKAMIRYGIGFDVFDVEAATKNGIMICNIPDYCIAEVASHASSMILALERQLLFHTMHIRDGVWKIIPTVPKRRLSSQILGFIGFGSIARQTARFLKAFGFQMIAYDPYLDDESFIELGVKRVDLDGLCKTSDIISIHTPLNDQTFHLINKERIHIMKDNVIIVNTSRGAVICEASLIEGLKDGKIAAVGLDVFENEPLDERDHPFFHMDNVLLSPHVSYDSTEASQELRRKVADIAIQVLRGDIPTSIINKKELRL